MRSIRIAGTCARKCATSSTWQPRDSVAPTGAVQGVRSAQGRTDSPFRRTADRRRTFQRRPTPLSLQAYLSLLRGSQFSIVKRGRHSMSAEIIAIAESQSRGNTRRSSAHASSTTCKPHFERRYTTHREAQEYLSSRGFLCLPLGWANGRWRANIESYECGVVVIVDMPNAALARSN